MYAKRTVPVQIPSPEYGTIHLAKSGYVLYITDSHWDKDKKRMVDSRTTIGKVLPDDKTRMYPGQRYFDLMDELNPAATLKSLSQDRRIGQLGRQISYGSYAVLYQAAEMIGCINAMKQAFPAIYREIIALAIYGIESGSLTAQKYEYWAFDHYLGLDKNMSDTTIGRIYDEIEGNRAGMVKFQMIFKDTIHQKIPDSGIRVIAFDSTNQNTSGKTSSLAEYGHAKKNKKLPIINTSVFVDEASGIPIYMENYIGSIPDKSQTPITMKRAKSLGYENLMFMMDRGYWASDSLKSIEASDFEFGIMVPDSVSIVDEMYLTYGEAVRNKTKYWIDEERIYGLKIRRKLDFLNKDQEYSVYLFYDDTRASKERLAINNKIAYMEETIKSRVKYSEKLKKTYGTWFNIEKSDKKDPATGKWFTFGPKEDVIQEEINRAGYFCIISDSDVSAAAMIKIARYRDTAEKLFSRIKTGLDMETSNVQDHHYEPKMFVSFVAEIIEKSFCYYAKSYLHKRTGSNSADLPILEMEKYKIEYGSTNEWYPVYAATKLQKEILKTVGLEEKDLLKQIHELN